MKINVQPVTTTTLAPILFLHAKPSNQSIHPLLSIHPLHPIPSINVTLLITLALPINRLIADLDGFGQFLISHTPQIASHLLQKLLLIRKQIEVMRQLLRGLIIVQQHPVIYLVL